LPRGAAVAGQGAGGGSRLSVMDRWGTPRWDWFALVCVFAGLGVVLVASAHNVSREGGEWASALFWLGLTAVFAPAAAALWAVKMRRSEAIAVLLVVGVALYVVKVLYNPEVLVGFDELLHLRTLDDIVRTGTVFAENPLLTVSPYYPGLEIVTTAAASLTGLGLVPSALVVIGVARVLGVLALYLFLERVAIPPRLAGLATLIYMASPSFVFFDAQYAYESLALPLALFCLFLLRMAQRAERPVRTGLHVLAAIAVVAVAVTHHVTSFILTGTLVLWALATLLFHRGRREVLPGGGWVPALAVIANIAWIATVAESTVGYLWPHAAAAVEEAIGLITLQSGGRVLFESSTGYSAPVLERVLGIASVLLTLLALPFGLRYVWRWQRHDALAALMALATVAYPATLLLRFTGSGWQVGARATAFIYVPLAFTVAAGIEQLRRTASPRLARAVLVAPLITLVCLGGVVAGSSPRTRLAGPYQPGAGSLSVETEGLEAAAWARSSLGPGNRVAADQTNATLLGSYGAQRIVSQPADGVIISGVFLGTEFGEYQRRLLADGDIEYVVADRRLLGVESMQGYFFEKWEREVFDYGATITPGVLVPYPTLDGVSRVFDSGNLQVYDVTDVQR
jgi:hypothetical protein